MAHLWPRLQVFWIFLQNPHVACHSGLNCELCLSCCNGEQTLSCQVLCHPDLHTRNKAHFGVVCLYLRCIQSGGRGAAGLGQRDQNQLADLILGEQSSLNAIAATTTDELCWIHSYRHFKNVSWSCISCNPNSAYPSTNSLGFIRNSIQCLKTSPVLRLAPRLVFSFPKGRRS